MKLVYIADLKSAGPQGPYGFESHPRYQKSKTRSPFNREDPGYRWEGLLNVLIPLLAIALAG